MKLLIREHQTIQVAERPITEERQAQIARTLAESGIRIAPAEDVFGVIHLHVLAPVTTEQEVTVLAAYVAETDMPLAWEPAGGEQGG